MTSARSRPAGTAKSSAPAKGGRCPICAEASDREYRPFCSRRCADIDLGRWLNGSYAIPGNVETEEDGSLPVAGSPATGTPQDPDD